MTAGLMSLRFCWDILMEGFEFGVNKVPGGKCNGVQYTDLLNNASSSEPQIISTVSRTWRWVYWTQVVSTVTGCQFSRAPLSWRNGRLRSWKCNWQICWNCDGIMSAWSLKHLQHLGEPMPQSFKAVLKTKGVQSSTTKVNPIESKMVQNLL